MVPVCSTTRKIHHELSLHTYIKCPDFNSLKPNLDQWVIDHNETLINKAHESGLSHPRL